MWDVMLDYEIRRRELALRSEYAWLARQAVPETRTRWGSAVRRRVSALLLALGARLAAPPSAPAVKPGSGWVPLLEDLSR